MKRNQIKSRKMTSGLEGTVSDHILIELPKGQGASARGWDTGSRRAGKVTNLPGFTINYSTLPFCIEIFPIKGICVYNRKKNSKIQKWQKAKVIPLRGKPRKDHL